MSQFNSISRKNPKILIQIAVLALAFTILFGRTIADLAQDWMTNDNYSHGFLVPFIAAYMIWKKKELLSRIRIHPSKSGLLIVLLGMFVFIIGNIGAELFFMRTAIVITIAGTCLSYLGYRMTAIIGVPLAYLLFMIPLPTIIWNKIAFPLQLLAANLTADVVQIIGIPLLRQGNIMHLPNTTLEVVDACSGLRSLTSLLALSAAFASISNLSTPNKWILFLSAIPVAIAVNILRLTATVLMARYIGPETAHGFLHDFSGLIVFAIAFIMLYGIYAIMQAIERKNQNYS